MKSENQAIVKIYNDETDAIDQIVKMSINSAKAIKWFNDYYETGFYVSYTPLDNYKELDF